MNRETEQAIAVKIIDLEKAADCYENVRKEVSDGEINRDDRKEWRSVNVYNNFIDKFTSFVCRFVFIACFKMFMSLDSTDKELKEINSIYSWSVLAVENYLTE